MKLNRRKRKAIRLGLATALVIGPLSALALAGVSINTTSCLPLGFYQSLPPKPLAVGQTWTVCLPRKWTAFGLQRGYLHPGTDCPGGSQPLIKEIAGLPGETVTVSQSGVTIDGKRWPLSIPLTRDTAGRPLVPDYGTHVIPPGTVWVMGISSKAWDSRYYGPIPEKGLLQRQKALLTWR